MGTRTRSIGRTPRIGAKSEAKGSYRSGVGAPGSDLDGALHHDGAVMALHAALHTLVRHGTTLVPHWYCASGAVYTGTRLVLYCAALVLHCYSTTVLVWIATTMILVVGAFGRVVKVALN